MAYVHMNRVAMLLISVILRGAKANRMYRDAQSSTNHNNNNTYSKFKTSIIRATMIANEINIPIADDSSPMLFNCTKNKSYKETTKRKQDFDGFHFLSSQFSVSSACGFFSFVIFNFIDVFCVAACFLLIMSRSIALLNNGVSFACCLKRKMC